MAYQPILIRMMQMTAQQVTVTMTVFQMISNALPVTRALTLTAMASLISPTPMMMAMVFRL